MVWWRGDQIPVITVEQVEIFTSENTLQYLPVIIFSI